MHELILDVHLGTKLSFESGDIGAQFMQISPNIDMTPGWRYDIVNTLRDKHLSTL